MEPRKFLARRPCENRKHRVFQIPELLKSIQSSKEVKTEELSIIASALASGYVKAKSSVNTSKAVYDAWYDAVYMPPAEAPEEEEEQGGETEPQG